MRRRLGVLVMTSVLAFGLLQVPAPGVLGDPKPATLSVHSVLRRATAMRFPGEPVMYVASGVYVAAPKGAFELHAVRGKGDTVDVWQVGRTSKGVKRLRKLPQLPETSMTNGLGGFVEFTLKDSSGAVVSQGTSPFCPNGWFGARIHGNGPEKRSYPFDCGGMRTRASIWGIDDGWAVPLFAEIPAPEGPDGDYTLSVNIARAYSKALSIDAKKVSASLTVSVVTAEDPPPCPEEPCPPPCPPDEPCPLTRRTASRARGADGRSADGRNASVPPGGSGLPDLAALPADSLEIQRNEGRDLLTFAATVWNAGPGQFVIEGFRAGDAPVIKAVQHIYENGKRVRSIKAGSFEYHPIEGHQHWHYLGFAGYDLLSADGSKTIRSDKMSFCVVPTDAVDLTRPGAQLQPESIGFGSACGGEEAIWLREVLPVGWGDTYVQTVPGQSFDVTDLPNGRYILRVTAAPSRLVTEASYKNNVANVTVELGGTPGERTVAIV